MRPAGAAKRACGAAAVRAAPYFLDQGPLHAMHAPGHKTGSYMLAFKLSSDNHALCFEAWQLVEQLLQDFAARACAAHMPQLCMAHMAICRLRFARCRTGVTAPDRMG